MALRIIMLLRREDRSSIVLLIHCLGSYHTTLPPARQDLDARPLRCYNPVDRHPYPGRHPGPEEPASREEKLK